VRLEVNQNDRCPIIGIGHFLQREAVGNFVQILVGLALSILLTSVSAQPVSILNRVAGAVTISPHMNVGWVKRQEYVQLSSAAKDAVLASGRMSLRLDLFSDVQIDLIETKRQTSTTGALVANFDLVGDKDGSAVLSNSGVAITATVSTGDHKVYRIMPVSNGLHRVEELDHSKFPDCANHKAPVVQAVSTDLTNSDSGDSDFDDGSQIAVLVAYTQAVESALGGASAVSSLISAAISESNTGFSVSGVPTQLSLVHAVKVNYDESTGFEPALNAITETSDGVMDEIHLLRDTYKADLTPWTPSTCRPARCSRSMPPNAPLATATRCSNTAAPSPRAGSRRWA
jgi:hypothetical protein